jgi:hypothetical protein
MLASGHRCAVLSLLGRFGRDAGSLGVAPDMIATRQICGNLLRRRKLAAPSQKLVKKHQIRCGAGLRRIFSFSVPVSHFRPRDYFLPETIPKKRGGLP